MNKPIEKVRKRDFNILAETLAERGRKGLGKFTMKLLCSYFVLLTTLIITGCGGDGGANVDLKQNPEIIPTETQVIVFQNEPTPTETISIDAVTTEIPKISKNSETQICLPIDGLTKAEVKNAVITPYLPPGPASDDPHHGIDLAVVIPGTNLAAEGSGVNAILPGKVTAIIKNRFPYGNSIIVETPLVSLNKNLVKKLNLPSPEASALTNNPLSCPIALDLPKEEEITSLSVYSLYGHMQNEPMFKVGDEIQCGQNLGLIGNSGNSINPHLHLETRVGFSGFTPESMAHYDASATTEEMKNYCIWRISGYFQHFDPMQVINQNSLE